MNPVGAINNPVMNRIHPACFELKRYIIPLSMEKDENRTQR